MKLTKKERNWIEDLQTVLDSCPSERIGFYTIGDSCLFLYDRRKEDKIGEIQDNSNRDFGMAVDEAKARIDDGTDLRFPYNVHSVAG